MQFYVLLYSIATIVNKIARQSFTKVLGIVLALCSLISAVLYFAMGGKGANFYGLHIRFFELGAGALLAMCGERVTCAQKLVEIDWLPTMVLVVLLGVNVNYVPDNCRLALTVILTLVAVLLSFQRNGDSRTAIVKG